MDLVGPRLSPSQLDAPRPFGRRGNIYLQGNIIEIAYDLSPLGVKSHASGQNVADHEFLLVSIFFGHDGGRV